MWYIHKTESSEIMSSARKWMKLYISFRRKKVTCFFSYVKSRLEKKDTNIEWRLFGKKGPAGR
jgi:hypothetical protein